MAGKKPFFVLAQVGDLYRVQVLATDLVPERGPACSRVEIETGPGLSGRGTPGWMLRGLAAELLYLALAGHRYGESSARARAELAYYARAHLATIREPGFYLACLVLRQAGEYIPGYACLGGN
jgi:hypothetical protein